MLRSSKRNYLPRNSFSQGFSIVELMVTITIVTVIITTVVRSQSSFVDGAALANLADEIGLTLSQAQAYGIAVRQLSPGSSDFSAAYGLTVSTLNAGDSLAYLFFADRNANRSYDGTWACVLGGSSECLEKKTISRGNYVDSVCSIRTSGTDQCSNIARVDISFKRPNLEAQLTFYNSAGNLYVPPNLTGAKIVLKSQSGLTRYIRVYQSGQISVLGT